MNEILSERKETDRLNEKRKEKEGSCKVVRMNESVSQ